MTVLSTAIEGKDRCRNRCLGTGKMIEKTACYLLIELVIKAMAASFCCVLSCYCGGSVSKRLFIH